MEYPLQTRAVRLTPDRLASQARIDKTLEDLSARMYNTVLMPVLHEGTPNFQTNQRGETRAEGCLGAYTLKKLKETNFSVWLSIDMLTAGTSGTGRLGRLARNNRHWLMRTIHGEFTPPEFPELPGLFCWTSASFRQYLSQLMVTLVDSYPVDAVVFNLQHLPRTTLNPESWTHLGFSCLQRIQRELGYNVEEHLSNPKLDDHNRIVHWRYEQLRMLLENLKARILRIRKDLPVMILAGVHDPGDPWTPWAAWNQGGLAESYLLHAPAEDLRKHFRAFDKGFKTKRPFLAVADAETDLGDLAKSLPTAPATGFCVLNPGPLERVVMPNAEFHWNQPGAIENRPVTAASEIVRNSIKLFMDCQVMRPYFEKVEQILTNAGESLKYEIAQTVRADINDTMRKLRKGEVEIDGDPKETARRLDLIGRLLSLANPGFVDY